MARKYRAGNKSDMKKFSKDLEKKVYSAASSGVKNMVHTVDCPQCKAPKKIVFKNGAGQCPTCYSRINLDLNWG